MPNPSCIFYNKSFLEDLYPYTITVENNAFLINFNVDGKIVSKPLQLDLPFLPNMKLSHDFWSPMWIDKNKSNLFITNSLLAYGFSIDSSDLGAENVLSFEPIFRNWKCSNNAKMSTDWILTSPAYPYEAQEGIMCWAKKTYTSNPNNQPLTIYDIPYNSIITSQYSLSYEIKTSDESKPITISIDEETLLIKKSNNILLIVDTPSVKRFADDTIGPSTTTQYFLLDDYLTHINAQQLKNKGKLFKKEDITFNYFNNTASNDIMYHISDGEAYSYFESKETAIIALEEKLPAKTYVSPVLHDIYRQIYHNLTLKAVKHFNKRIPKPIFNRKQGRIIKSLCGYLSTHPQIDRTTVSILQHPDIQNYLDECLTGDITIQNMILKISPYFKDLNTDESKYVNPTYIPNKLIDKYGSKLQFKGSDGLGTLKYTPALPNGPHLKVSSDIRSLGQKDINNTFMLSNIRIDVGPFTAETILNANTSALQLSSSLDPKTNIIPLWDIQKKIAMEAGAPFTVGPDIEKDFGGDELSIDLDSAELLFEKKDSALAGANISFEWTRISGPDCLRFSNRTLTTVRSMGLFIRDAGDLRFETSQDESPTVYIRKPGKYVIQCAVKTSFGVKTQRLNIYINGPGYTRPRSEIPRPAKNIDLLPNNRNIVMSHGLKEFAFGKQGIFWPVYSDLSVLEPKYLVVPSVVAGLENKRRIGEEVKPLGSVLNKFLIVYDRDSAAAQDIVRGVNPSYFSMIFEQSETVITEISHITLSHLNSIETPYCEPLYRETFDHSLGDLELDATKVLVDPLSEKDIEVLRPGTIKTQDIQVSASQLNEKILRAAIFDNPNEILNFEGYDYVRDIYSLDIENFSSKDNPVICYEKYSDDTAVKDSQTIEMKKGYLHPNSGWLPSSLLDDDMKNKTSIMIGDGAKKYCKTFKGLGFDELSNDFIDGKVKVFQSSITLKMDMESAADPYERPEENISHLSRVQIEAKDVNDHQVNYGYRDVSDRLRAAYKYTDEFKVNPTIAPDIPVNSNEYCEDLNIGTDISDEQFDLGDITRISYSYVSPGPIMASKVAGPREARYDREFGRLLGDLEVKLNYLNYINPKELVIWLTITPPSQPQAVFDINKKIISYKKEIIDNIYNDQIRTYISGLYELNKPVELPIAVTGDEPAPGPRHPYYLYLLNQDHINVSIYNNILKFTDNAQSDANNINISHFITADTSSAMLQNGVVELQPTLSAPEYNDLEINKYKTIVKSNHLKECTLSTFNTVRNLPLFASFVNPEGLPKTPENASDTTFTLNIAIIGETDDGSVYDRILYTDNLININNVKTRNISNILTSSLCSWEIIINNDKSLLNFEDKDALGLINYKSDIPAYDGYNFIGKIPSNLIPPINKDAPNRSFFDTSRCFYSKERLTTQRVLPLPTLNLTPYTYIPNGTLVGELSSISNMGAYMNIQAREWYNYFNDLRRVELAERFNREIYIPRFFSFPTGRSDKALISFSKDKIVWYKLEAGIMRYNNCHIIKKRKYAYQKIHYLNQFRDLAKFVLKNIPNPGSLLSYKTKIIKEITPDPLIADVADYKFRIQDIFNDIQNEPSDNIIKIIKNKIYDLNNLIISLTESKKTASTEKVEIIATTLKECERLLSEYKAAYKTIGPEGVLDDDIIVFEQMQDKQNSDGTTTKVPVRSYNTAVFKNNVINLIYCLNFSDLLKYNKSFFIENKLLSISSSLQKYSIEDKVSITILFAIDGIRAYSIYKIGQHVDIFTPKKELTENEKVTLEQLNKDLAAQKKLLKAFLEENQEEEIIKNLESKIMDIENKIFKLIHIQSTNQIIGKGIMRSKDQYITLFELNTNVADNSILVIKPEDNRIISWDSDYIGKKNELNTVNFWPFVNETCVLSDVISLSDQNTFNNGMYGTGTIGSRVTNLYSPDIVNYIRNFISYLETNAFSPNFVENIKFMKDRESVSKTDAFLKNIFLWDMENTSSLIRKHTNILKLKLKDKLGKEFIDIFSTIDIIHNYDIYNAFIKEKNTKIFIEGFAEMTRTVDRMEDTGYIEFESNNTSEKLYALKDSSPARLRELLDLINEIPDTIIRKQQDIERLTEQIEKTKIPAEKEKILADIEELKNLIHRLHITYNKGLFYLYKFERQPITIDNNSNVFPNIYVDFATDLLDVVRFFESSNDDYYIINIDAEQNCSIDNDKLPKILMRIDYECLAVVLPSYLEQFRFCGGASSTAAAGGGAFIGKPNYVTGDYNLQVFNDRSVYTLLPDKVTELKQKYAHPRLDWNNAVTLRSERTFFLNGADLRGGIVKASYRYLVPKVISLPDDIGIREGNSTSKVKTIYNLNNTDNLYVDFKKINRNLRNIDNRYERYLPTVDGLLVKDLAPIPGGPIDNTLKIWECFGLRDGLKTRLPPNIKWMNLVKYMSFYNKYLFDNANGLFDINGGMDLMKTRDEMGLIPYDYK